MSAETETKVIYHIDDEDTPYLVKLPVAPDKVTLGDFKNVLNRPNFKFFFKSVDDDFGVVKVVRFEFDFAYLLDPQCTTRLLMVDPVNQQDRIRIGQPFV